MHTRPFAKEPYIRDDILQKRPVILRSLLIEDTVYLIRRPKKRMHTKQFVCIGVCTVWYVYLFIK